MRILACRDGFSLAEMLIVIGIIAILLAVAAPMFSNWTTRYNIEAQIKQMYADIQTARSRAIYTNRMHFLTVNGGNFTITDDTSPLPNGDSTLTAGVDTVIETRNYSNIMNFSPGFGPNLNFDARGISNVGNGTTQALCIVSTVSPDYDCIILSQCGINMGRLNPGGACVVANCIAK